MTLFELNTLLRERKTTRTLLEEWVRLRWSPLEADEISKRIAAVVYRPLEHVSKRERISHGTVAAIIVEAQAKAGTPNVRDWQDAIAFDTSSVHREIIRRIEELVAPFEDVVPDEVTS